MLSRAYTRPRKSTKNTAENSSKSGWSMSINDEYGDCIVGFMDDLPLIPCGGTHTAAMTLRQILRGSVGVMGESRLGMTEKVVLLKGKEFAVKRFRKVTVGRAEFGRRVDRLAGFSQKCEYLVPIAAYLYAKRTKFLLCNYYPMGSLADLLSGGRKRGHTTLDWNQRRAIILDVARAIAYIHAQCPPLEKNMQLNFHGNIKSSNVMINVDFSARLSDYGLVQLAERIELSDTCQQKPPPSEETIYCETLGQKSDIYNFGIVLLDILGGFPAPGLIKLCKMDEREKTRGSEIEFSEFSAEGKGRKQALKVLDIALACINRRAEARPSMEHILLFLGDVLRYK